VFIAVYFVIDSVRKLLDTPSCYQHRIWPVTRRGQGGRPMTNKNRNCLDYRQKLVMSSRKAQCQDGGTDRLTGWLTDW